jgi:predicted GNAT family acetyltransferase
VIAVTDNPARSRFEAHDGDQIVGWLEYLPAGDSVILAHTESLREGAGVGGELVRGALAAIAERDMTVIPTCPFAVAYIGRHPELVERVVPGLRPQFHS